MSKEFALGFLFCMSALAAAYPAGADPLPANWFTPQALSDSNVTVGFEVDTTWHTVRGTSSGAHGTVRVSTAGDSSHVNIAIAIPVSTFNTENPERDERLREIMAADNYPEVEFQSDAAALYCTPARVLADGSCTDTLGGSLHIRSTTRTVTMPVVIRSRGDGFEVTGEFPVHWSDYGVEDPSLFLIAKVDPVVQIRFVVTLAPRPAVTTQ